MIEKFSDEDGMVITTTESKSLKHEPFRLQPPIISSAPLTFNMTTVRTSVAMADFEIFMVQIHLEFCSKKTLWVLLREDNLTKTNLGGKIIDLTGRSGINISYQSCLSRIFLYGSILSTTSIFERCNNESEVISVNILDCRLEVFEISSVW
ncbi:hypothetical protein Glove_173g40 [Diversispora epigaea]|uniref:Uncharacterized protein n=1 Tax=Diversispora epigaea TaxID=1348612 RepID=A0A397IXD4_9GLOM|nr:hypothetical protein Glove_173g40 [Diversispora epigaea]